MEFDTNKWVRKNIREMKAYSSARQEFTGTATVWLDANENAWGSPLPSLPGEAIAGSRYNRYPDPLQYALKEKICAIKGVPPMNIFLGNGSDEAIDLLFRIFCEPGRDNVLLFPPTYGMYEVAAAMNDIAVKQVPLTNRFQLDLPAIEAAIDQQTKMIFICSPNNPTGNSIDRGAIELLLNNFDGLVIIDEAYINYAKQQSFIPDLADYTNLVILQTFSKAWGLAGLRLGMAFAATSVIDYMNKVKYPYNISETTQELVLQALDNTSTVNGWTRSTVEQRESLKKELEQLPFTVQVYPSDANFILVKMKQATTIYSFLAGQGIIVRDRSRVILCDDCLRITVGTPAENKQLINTLKSFRS